MIFSTCWTEAVLGRCNNFDNMKFTCFQTYNFQKVMIALLKFELTGDLFFLLFHLYIYVKVFSVGILFRLLSYIIAYEGI